MSVTPAGTAASGAPCASVCPLCGQSNACAMEVARAQGASAQACWCTTVTFSAELLARVPAPARGKACICSACANAAAAGITRQVPDGSALK